VNKTNKNVLKGLNENVLKFPLIAAITIIKFKIQFVIRGFGLY